MLVNNPCQGHSVSHLVFFRLYGSDEMTSDLDPILVAPWLSNFFMLNSTEHDISTACKS